ncbi:MAG: FAD-dependent oxidoreductase [Anaerococcus sp.]|nr:FAD-dependent oxidoreductase [Anaerococcus sp.]
MYNYLIIGNGIAGLSAAEEIRKHNKDAKILIVSEENQTTYWRTRLSDLISKDFDKDKIWVKKDDWYKENNIDQMLATKVLKIDRANKKVSLEDGKTISFDKLLLATGAHAFIPPIKNISCKGVFAIRTSDDLIDFKTYIKDKSSLAVIGGGILGLEAAFSAKKLGLDVTVIESFDYLLSKQLDKELSLKLEEALNDLGIKTVKGKNTTEILSEDGKVSGLKLEDGKVIEASAVIVQAGVRSNIEMAKDSGLKTDRGILVDESLATENPCIYAAGDNAQIGDFTIGLWTASLEMGKIAGANMTGDNLSYHKPKPFTTLMLGGIKLFSAGQNSGDGIKEERVEKDGKIYKLFKKDDKYVGGILWQDIKYQNDVKAIVFDNKDPKDTKLGKEIFDK